MDRLQAHQAHQTLDSLAVDLLPLTGQPDGHPTTAEVGCLEILLVDPPHQSQVLDRLRRRLVVVSSTG